MAGRHRVRRCIASVLLGLCAFLPMRLIAWAEGSPVPHDVRAASLILECAGRASDGKGLPAPGGETRFTVTATFGEGAIVALVDPQTSAIRPLYDAESTSGSLRLSDGAEATIVWTRMSGAAGALVGEAILSDGDVIALTLEAAGQGAAERPFALFTAASASLIRGACAATAPR